MIWLAHSKTDICNILRLFQVDALCLANCPFVPSILECNTVDELLLCGESTNLRTIFISLSKEKKKPEEVNCWKKPRLLSDDEEDDTQDFESDSEDDFQDDDTHKTQQPVERTHRSGTSFIVNDAESKKFSRYYSSERKRSRKRLMVCS